MWWSFAVGLSPMPIKFIKHITISIHMALDVESLKRQVDSTEDPII